MTSADRCSCNAASEGTMAPEGNSRPVGLKDKKRGNHFSPLSKRGWEGKNYGNCHPGCRDLPGRGCNDPARGASNGGEGRRPAPGGRAGRQGGVLPLPTAARGLSGCLPAQRNPRIAAV